MTRPGAFLRLLPLILAARACQGAAVAGTDEPDGGPPAALVMPPVVAPPVTIALPIHSWIRCAVTNEPEQNKTCPSGLEMITNDGRRFVLTEAALDELMASALGEEACEARLAESDRDHLAEPARPPGGRSAVKAVGAVAAVAASAGLGWALGGKEGAAVGGLVGGAFVAGAWTF